MNRSYFNCILTAYFRAGWWTLHKMEFRRFEIYCNSPFQLPPMSKESDRHTRTHNFLVPHGNSPLYIGQWEVWKINEVVLFKSAVSYCMGHLLDLNGEDSGRHGGRAYSVYVIAKGRLFVCLLRQSICYRYPTHDSFLAFRLKISPVKNWKNGIILLAVRHCKFYGIEPPAQKC